MRASERSRRPCGQLNSNNSVKVPFHRQQMATKSGDARCLRMIERRVASMLMTRAARSALSVRPRIVMSHRQMPIKTKRRANFSMRRRRRRFARRIGTIEHGSACDQSSTLTQTKARMRTLSEITIQLLALSEQVVIYHPFK